MHSLSSTAESPQQPRQLMTRLHIVGVRHHSPACARLARSVIRATKPAFVLIEGPSDMNDRLDELNLDHDPPIALFSFLRGDGGPDRASWYPICSSSPEWVSMQTASEVNASVKFMDLPAWHRAFGERVNLSSDGTDRYGAVIDLLCERTGTVGLDALWDHLFEGVEDLTLLAQALDAYFDELRALGDASPGDLQREEHMRAWITSALGQTDGDVVVVCGGFHGPALRINGPAVQTPWPDPPTPEEGRAETYLVPYANERLDSFTGYQSGMPSPAYYDALFTNGPAAASELLLKRVVAGLRADKQPVSTADLVAVTALVEGLARLRGHATPLRVDLLDGIATALLKSASDVRLPWEERGPLHPRTHPLLAHVVRTFRGDRIGVLDSRTPRPPLLHDALAELEAASITVTERATALNLDRTNPNDIRRASVLHRLRILGVPGFARIGSGLAIDETWEVQFQLERDVALIEASIYGPTLATAAAGKLVQLLGKAKVSGSSVDAASVLLEAILGSLDTLTNEAIQVAAQAIEADSDLARLSGALDVFRLLLGDGSETSTIRTQIIEIAKQATDRFLWLLEQLSGESQPTDDSIVRGVVALVELVRRFEQLPPGLHGTLERRATDRECPSGVRGACLGAVWNLELVPDGRDLALRALHAIGPDEHPGDLLGGLFATARHQFAQHHDLIEAIDAMVSGWTPEEFLRLLPGLRRAFAWFPSRERSKLGEQLARIHGLATSTRMVTQLRDDPLLVATGNAFDERLQARLRAFGLLLNEEVVPS
jgi:Family of unknown function (DUF5682)